MKEKLVNTTSCDICHQIICRKSGWVASHKEVFLIQQKVLVTCPVCGWKPGDQLHCHPF